MTDTKKLYLANSNFNQTKIYSFMEALAVEQGGQLIKPQFSTVPVTFYNRSYLEEIQKNERSIESLSMLIGNSQKPELDERRKTRLAELKKRNAELERLYKEQTPFTINESQYTWGKCGARFVLDGFLYSISGDQNPFFEKHYTKIELDSENNYTNEFYCDELDAPCYDLIFKLGATDEELREIAKLWFNALIGAKKSQGVPRSQSRYWGKVRHVETI